MLLGEITVLVEKEAAASSERFTSWAATASSVFAQYPIIGSLLILMSLDIATGIMSAWISKEISSSTSYRGMVGKAMILAMVATGAVAELIIPGVPWGQCIAMFFCVTELISISENAGRSGVPLPKQWTDALSKMREADRPPITRVEISSRKENE